MPLIDEYIGSKNFPRPNSKKGRLLDAELAQMEYHRHQEALKELLAWHEPTKLHVFLARQTIDGCLWSHHPEEIGKKSLTEIAEQHGLTLDEIEVVLNSGFYLIRKKRQT